MSNRRGRPPWVPSLEQDRAIVALRKRTSAFEHAWRKREAALERAIELGIPDVHIASAAHTTRLTIARRRKDSAA